MLMLVCKLSSLPTAPSSAPTGVVCEGTSSTEIIARWNNLPPGSRNGLVRGYTVILTDAASGEQTSQNSSTRRSTFMNLRPYHTYRCKVAAYTVALGPFSTEEQGTTQAGGKMIGQGMLWSSGKM